MRQPYLAVFFAAFVLSGPAAAQTPDPDRAIDLGQPDFTLSSLPTTMRMPAHTFDFRLTHRFTRPIDSGSSGCRHQTAGSSRSQVKTSCSPSVALRWWPS